MAHASHYNAQTEGMPGCSPIINLQANISGNISYTEDLKALMGDSKI